MLSLLTVLSASGQEPSLVIETYNVGLAHGFVDYGVERLPGIIAAIQDSDADVVCLQEAWEDDDREDIEDAVSALFPHTQYTATTQRKADASPACRRGELFGEGRFVSCMQTDCAGTSGDDRTDCIIEQCGPVLDALKTENPQCANALMAQVGKSAPMALWTILRPIRKAGLYAYGGSNGLMLLSRQPLSDAGVLDLSDIATLNRRQALYVDVPLAEGTARVYCTHLSADLSEIAPYPGPFASWGEENAAQIDALLAHAAGLEHVALVGDFNCGMDGDGLVGELSESCQAVLDADYLDPVVTLSGQCTWCRDNLLNADDGEENEALIDHVFTRGLTPTAATRAYTQTLDIGDGVTTSLSDHYGYRVTVSYGDPPPPPPPVLEPLVNPMEDSAE
ncbi:MAG: endonuclease/exonuclease/phosphatase family metal-dependent hydrolase [Myxococcota bacterium]|jgi:endonuclease/exonuclease/phosphatase family metal-dependent hydrolase